MKVLVFFIVSVFSFGLSAQEVILQPIKGSKRWQAKVVQNHQIWGKDACVAFVDSSNKEALLEVYAEKEGEEFVEPTVLVSLVGSEAFTHAKVRKNGRRQVIGSLTLASSSAQSPDTQVAMARIEPRESLIRTIRAANSLNVDLYDQDRLVKKLSFSLSGSSRTVRNAFAACKLKFDQSL